MAIEDDRRDISSANGLAGRLRGAWHALFGSPTITNSAAVARTTGQVVASPQARLIEQIIGGVNGNGRVNVRYSGTESLARVMVEAESEDTVHRLAAEIAAALDAAIGAAGPVEH